MAVAVSLKILLEKAKILFLTIVVSTTSFLSSHSPKGVHMSHLCEVPRMCVCVQRSYMIMGNRRNRGPIRVTIITP